MAIKNLEAALKEELQDLLSAEKQLTRALPKMAKTATSPDLRAAFEDHLAQTEEHVTRIEEAFSLLGKKATSKTCEAMKGLIAEGASIMEEEAEPETMDALLIAAAQKVEHYEIASYGSVCSWAETLGLTEIKNLLDETLEDEKDADDILTRLSSAINQAATPVS